MNCRRTEALADFLESLGDNFDKSPTDEQEILMLAQLWKGTLSILDTSACTELQLAQLWSKYLGLNESKMLELIISDMTPAEMAQQLRSMVSIS